MDEIIVEQFVIVKGIRTHVVENGNGPALVLLHGIGGPLMWQRVLEPLSEKFHVVQVDLPGFGDSDCPPSPYSTEQYADFVAELLSTFPQEKLNLVGISYGGQIAIHALEKIPERVDHLVLINTTGVRQQTFLPTRSPILWNLFSFFVRNFLLRSLWFICNLSKDSYYNIKNRPENLCRDFHRQLMQTGKRDTWLQTIKNIYTRDESFYRIAKELSIPTLILAGEQDVTVSSHYAEQLHREIKNSKLSIFPECAHSLPLEKPAELTQAICDFVFQPNKGEQL